MTKNILVGAHVSISGGLHKSIQKGEEIGCTAIQIFNKSSKSWHAKKLTEKEIDLFKNELNKSKIQSVISHTSYLINLCSSNPETEKKSCAALLDELQRCEALGIPYLVLHPGSHTGAGETKGIEKIAKNLDLVLSKTKKTTKVLLEVTAGQGTNLGYTFEQIAQIIILCKQKKSIGVCLDTCHMFSAGYDFSTEKKYKQVLEQFDKIIGIKKLKAIHINSSKTPLGSRKDRHEFLKEGTIPTKAFECIMNDKRLKDVPKILETPVNDESEYAPEIKILKQMAKD